MKKDFTKLGFKLTDGGRAKAGFHGRTGDCVVRAIAVANNFAYAATYEAMNCWCEGVPKDYPKHYAHKGISFGVMSVALHQYGWMYVPCDHPGMPKKFFVKEHLPKGTIVVRLRRKRGEKHDHVCAVKDHVVQDTGNTVVIGLRRVMGYFVRKPKKGKKLKS